MIFNWLENTTLILYIIHEKDIKINAEDFLNNNT